MVLMASCQNRGPFLGTLNSGCRIILETPKRTIILTTTLTISQGVLMILMLCSLRVRGLGLEGVLARGVDPSTLATPKH